LTFFSRETFDIVAVGVALQAISEEGVEGVSEKCSCILWKFCGKNISVDKDGRTRENFIVLLPKKGPSHTMQRTYIRFYTDFQFEHFKDLNLYGMIEINIDHFSYYIFCEE
jgi:hypothetical protein